MASELSPTPSSRLSRGRSPGPSPGLAPGLSPGQRQALDGLVHAGTLTPEQATAVRAMLDSAAEPRPARRWPIEIAGYLGGALVFAGAGLLVGASWEDLTRPARVAVLAAATVLLVVAAVLIAGGPLRIRAAVPAGSTVRGRIVSVLLALATGTGALTAAVAVTTHEATAGGATGLGLAVLAYLLLQPSLPVLLAAAVSSMVTAGALASDLMTGTPLRLTVAFTALGVAWAVLGLLGVSRHSGAALTFGGAIALFGAQQPLAGGEPGWAYLLTLLVAMGCLAAYAYDRGVLLLAVGVVATTLAVSESIADWTQGAAGGAIAVLAAGAVLLLGSLLGLRLHGRQHHPRH